MCQMPEKACRTELYNLAEDPNETRNLATEGKMKRKIGDLKKIIMDEYRR